MSPQWHVPLVGGPLAVPVHGLFVALGVLAATVVFAYEARRRAAVNEQSLVAVAGALIGGAIGMRLSGWAQHLDVTANENLIQAWQFGSKSILGGLLGAYLGGLIAERIGGYRGKTGDLFAPAVALGLAIGRSAAISPRHPVGRPVCHGVSTRRPPPRSARDVLPDRRCTRRSCTRSSSS